jgi:hypothetical protein
MSRAAKRRISSIVLSLALGLSCANAAEESKDGAGAAKEPLASEIEKILSTIDREAPSALKDLDGKARARVIAALLKASGSGVVLLDSAPKNVSPEDAKTSQAKPGPALEKGEPLADGKILYLRVERVDGSLAKALDDELSAKLGQANPPLGLTLDLRTAEGSSCAAAIAAFDALEKNPALAATNGHIAVLIGPKTKGSAEVFAALLERAKLGLLIGAPSAGAPFPVKIVEVAPYTLSIPEIPGRLAFMRQLPLKPAIALNGQTKTPAAGKAVPADDAALARAIDLLVGLDAIKRKWKAK